jgi:hypothetical protein
MSVFKVRDAFLALTYEQQAMIVDDWMERTPITTVMASSAPKISIAEMRSQSEHVKRKKYSRDGMPYDEQEAEACDALILQGYRNEETARWLSSNRPSQRTHNAWLQFVTKRRVALKAKGELK